VPLVMTGLVLWGTSQWWNNRSSHQRFRPTEDQQEEKLFPIDNNNNNNLGFNPNNNNVEPLQHHQPQQQEGGPSILSLRVRKGEQLVPVEIDSRKSGAELKQLSFPEEVAAGRRVTLIHQGQRIVDHLSLQQQRVQNHSVILSAIGEVAAAGGIPRPNSARAGPVTEFVVVPAAGILGTLWACYYLFREELFTPMSLWMLIGLTLGFFAGVRSLTSGP